MFHNKEVATVQNTIPNYGSGYAANFDIRARCGQTQPILSLRYRCKDLKNIILWPQFTTMSTRTRFRNCLLLLENYGIPLDINEWEN